ASSIIVLIFYYFYHGIRAACLEQALFLLPIFSIATLRQLPFRNGISSAALISIAPPFFLFVAIFLPLR
ncbi:unnamed protein product, partial [Musa acuminata subsp. burmannicoides]